MKWHARVVGRMDLPPEDQRLVLDHVTLSGQDYSNRELRQLCVIGSRLENCRFDGLRVPKTHVSFGSGMEPSEYINCSFDGARIAITGGLERFVNCSFRNVEIAKWLCLTTELVNCTFSGTLRNAVFHGRVPQEELRVLGRVIDWRALTGREVNGFHGNDFEGMNLINVAFRTGIDLTRQRLPTSPQYLYLPDAAQSFTRVRSELAGWWDGAPESRQAAIRMVDGWLEEVITDGQRQLLLREKNYHRIPGIPRDAIDKIFALLRSE